MADPISTFDKLLQMTGLISPPEQPQQAVTPESLDFNRIAAVPTAERDPARMSEDEKLLREGNGVELERKYGADKASEMLRQYALAGQRVLNDQTSTRSGAESLSDNADTFSQSVVNGILGLATVGGAVADKVIGGPFDGSAVRLSQASQELSRRFEAISSPASQAHQRVKALRSAVRAEESAQQAKEEIATGSSEVWANLKRLGRNLLSGVELAVEDPMTLSKGAVDAAGSIVLSSGVSKALGAVGEGFLAEASKSLAAKTAARLATVNQVGSFMAASSLAEAGGGYQSAANEVMSRPVESLWETSEPFRQKTQELMQSGLPEGEAALKAREWLANEVGTTTALVTGAVAAPFAIAAHGSATPTRILRSLLKDAAGEALEEGVVSGVQTLAQNQAIKSQVDARQDSLAGVGESFGESALLGALASGGMKAPGAAFQAPLAAGAALIQASENRRAKQAEGFQNSSKSLTEQAETLYSTGSKSLTESVNKAFSQDQEVLKAVQPMLMELVNSPVVHELPSQHQALSPAHQAQFEPGQNRVEAVEKASKLLLEEKDAGQQAELALFLSQLMEPARRFSETPDAFGPLSSNAEVMEQVGQYQRVLAGMSQLPMVQQALARAKEVLQPAGELTAESLVTPEGQKAAQVLAAQAVLNPGLDGKVSSETVQQVLLHAADKVSVVQRRALQGSLALLEAREKVEAQKLPDAIRALKEQHLAGDRTKESVGRQATTETDSEMLENGKYSARQHTDRIINAMMSGNLSLAKAHLTDFGLFVQHFQNKVQALNTSFDSRNARVVPYKQLIPETREFKSSASNPNSKHKGMSVQVKAVESIKFAQTVDAEAHLLHSLHESLVRAFPELKEKALPVQRLNGALRKTNTKAMAEQKARNQSQEKQPEVVQPRKEQTITEKVEMEEQPQTASQVDQLERAGTRVDRKAVSPAPATTKPTEVSSSVVAPAPKQQKQEVDQFARGETRIDRKAVTPEPAPRNEVKQEPVKNEVVTEKLEQVEEPAPEPKQEEAPIAPEPVKVPETVAGLFPKLHQVVGKVRNFFQEAFSPKPASTRLLGKTGSATLVRNAIKVDGEFKALTGKEPRQTLTEAVRKHYGALLRLDAGEKDARTMGGVLAALQGNLDAFLQSTWKDGISFEQAFREGLTEVNLISRGKVLNLVELDEAGKFRYNPELLQQAVLAAYQWQIAAGQRQAPMKEDEVADELGVEEVDAELLKLLLQGESTDDAKNSLANTIRRFWGVQGDSKKPMGVTEAIPEAMAAEMLRALEQVGLVTVNRIPLKKYGLADDKRTVDRYIAFDWNQPGKESPFYAYPNLLEEVVVVQPEALEFYGNDEVPVLTRQLSNDQVLTSKESNQARENMQKQKFFFNMPMVEALLSLTDETLVALFGTELPPDAASKFNKNHLDSLESNNLSLRGALAELRRLKQRMEYLVEDAKAKGQQADLGSLAKKYQYAVNSANRIMMLGAYNPQSSKLMREALMPTWSTLDLSGGLKSEHYRLAMQAVAQALGRKVHNFPLEENVTWAHEAVTTGAWAPAVKVLSSWLGSGKPFPVKAFKQALGAKESSPLVLMALTEVARIQKASKEELKAFRTPLYLESDGMTNGPFNSMGLLAVGEVTANDITNWRRGGLNVGKAPMTADKLRELADKKDLYQAGMDEARVEVANRLKTVNKSKEAKPLANHLFNAMELLLDGEVKWVDEGKGELEFARGLGKNPMTVLVYGSGTGGIANKIAGRLQTAFYEKLSVVARVLSEGGNMQDAAVEMFPGTAPEQAMVQAKKLWAAMNAITGAEVVWSKEERKYVLDNVSGQKALKRVEGENGYQEFGFEKDELERMQENLLTLFVTPMQKGIQRVLGPSVFTSGKLLVKATQAQSVLARELYLQEILKRIAQKREVLEKSGMSPKEAQARVATEFLSREELDQVWDSLSNVMPLVESDGQRFLVAKTSLLKFWEGKGSDKVRQKLFQYSRDLEGGARTAPYAKSVDAAGVSGIPYMTIGMGDARMVRKIFEQIFEGALQVFDGINVPVDRITEYGPRINQAALHAWQGNVFQSMARSYARFLKDPRVKTAMADAEMVKVLGNERVDVTEMEQTLRELESFARMQEARRIALSKFALSMDQMAGTYQPFVSEGQDVPAGASATEIANLINAEYQKALETLTKPQEGKAPVTFDAKALGRLGHQHTSGAWVLTKNALPRLAQALKETLSKQEREILGELLESGALGETKVVLGTREEVALYQMAMGTSSLDRQTEGNPGKTIHGYFEPNENVVYLLSGQTETLLHELVHAATYGLVEAHYAGKTKLKHVAEAVTRLENLMKLFLREDFEGEAYENAREAILTYDPLAPDATAADKAAALNEFMAWTLANRDLVEELSKKSLENAMTRGEEKLSRLARLTRKAYEAIKRLLWGDRKGPSFGEDFMSQVRFNTAVLARMAPTLEVEVRGLALTHAVLNGEAPTRARQMLETFGKRVARHLDQKYSTGLLEKLGAQGLLGKQFNLSDAVAAKAKRIFGLSDEAHHAFQMMVLAFATESIIEPAVMTEAQKAFDHFLRNLDQKDFLTGKGDAQNDLAQAIEKFEFISGHSLRKTDPKGRSTLLPVFLALAQVDESFRALLAKKELPGREKQQIVGMDTALENMGSTLLEKLEGWLTGTDQPDTVKAAIDQLTQHVIKTTEEAKSLLEQNLERVDKAGYGVNAKMVELLQRMGKAAGKNGRALSKSDSEFAKKMGVVLRAAALMSSEKEAAVVSEEMLSYMDKHPEMWTSFRELAADLLGRTASQAEVYDMVKRVRSEVAQSRQAYRENVPAIISSKFKQAPSQEQWHALYQMMGRYDLAALLDGRTVKQVLELAGDTKALKVEIERLSSALKADHPAQAKRYQAKVDQYVTFVQTGVRGNNLLRNAWAISELLGEHNDQKTWVAPTEETVQTIDQLITLKLLAQTSEQDLQRYTSLLKSEEAGLEFVLNYLKGQRKTELSKAQEGPAKFNHYKGLLPYEPQGRGHVIVDEDTQEEHLTELGYERLGAYKGSTLEKGGVSRSYYFSPEGGVKTMYNQGIAQNVQQTAYGVHMETGFSTGLTGGAITDPVTVQYLAERLKLGMEAAGTETLSPLYDGTGKVVAFERSLDPKHLKMLEQPQNLAKVIGQWQGRQVEEVQAAKVNEGLVDELHAMWAKDVDEDAGNQDRYVNLFDTKNLDPVIRDAVSIMPRGLKAYARAKFGPGKFYVRHNMLNMVIGYRNASVGDFWTGTTRWSKETQENVKKSLQAVLGMDAYRMLVSAERNWQAVMASVRTNIVVRSIVVPAANFASGIYQLGARGVPLRHALKAVPTKIAEIEYYTKTAARKIELEAEKFANEHNVERVRTIDAQLLALEDSLKRLSIWPLLEAGEFSTISDVGQTAEDLGVGPNNIVEKLTQAVDKLPPGLRDLARQGYMARDTALFQVLQKSVQYSDFVMKAIYFDHLTKKSGKSVKAAKAAITEEFNNYDIPTGRTRGYVESMGVAWFLNYKIRSTKIALSMIRNNPLNLLLYAVLPHPFASGIPVTDNLFASIFRKTIGYGLGPNMVVQPIALNPWYSLIAD